MITCSYEKIRIFSTSYEWFRVVTGIVKRSYEWFRLVTSGYE